MYELPFDTALFFLRSIFARLQVSGFFIFCVGNRNGFTIFGSGTERVIKGF